METETTNNLVNFNSNELTLANVKDVSEQYIQAIKEGFLSPLEAAVNIKTIENLCETVRKATLENALKEMGDNKSYDLKGYKISVMEAATSYKYENCNDSIWNDLIEEKKVLDKKIKERETFLKSIKDPLDVLNKETGELFTINPPIKTSTTTLKFEVKK